jgi:phage replication-related protein YjqB (UPF0714/DUF867 family)
MPRNFEEILDAGYREGKDFRVSMDNLDALQSCLLAAPHGGGIEPGTSEITRATAALNKRAFYLFEGILKSGNKDRLHIDSTGFTEPNVTNLAPKTDFLVTVHGENDKKKAIIYVGGLYQRGKDIFIRQLSNDLGMLKVEVVDAASSDGGEKIAGRSPQNLTNTGRRKEGVQLEISKRARLIFFPDLSAKGRQNPSPHLSILVGSIERAITELLAP